MPLMPMTCPSGTYFDGMQCQPMPTNGVFNCVNGGSYNGVSCVTMPPVLVPVSCPSGTYFNGVQCQPMLSNGAVTCLNGGSYNGAVCIPSSYPTSGSSVTLIPVSCASGTYFDGVQCRSSTTGGNTSPGGASSSPTTPTPTPTPSVSAQPSPPPTPILLLTATSLTQSSVPAVVTVRDGSFITLNVTLLMPLPAGAVLVVNASATPLVTAPHHAVSVSPAVMLFSPTTPAFAVTVSVRALTPTTSSSSSPVVAENFTLALQAMSYVNGHPVVPLRGILQAVDASVCPTGQVASSGGVCGCPAGSNMVVSGADALSTCVCNPVGFLSVPQGNGTQLCVVRAPLSLTLTNTSVVEGGGVTVGVALSAPPAPGRVVIVRPAALPARVTLSPLSFTFTAANWSSPVAASLGVLPDGVVTGTLPANVTFVVDAATTDPAFVLSPVHAASAVVAVLDRDVPTLLVSAAALAVLKDAVAGSAGASATYFLSLGTAPTSVVIVTVLPSLANAVVVTPPRVYFDATNYSLPVTVNVTAVAGVPARPGFDTIALTLLHTVDSAAGTTSSSPTSSGPSASPTPLPAVGAPRSLESSSATVSAAGGGSVTSGAGAAAVAYRISASMAPAVNVTLFERVAMTMDAQPRVLALTEGTSLAVTIRLSYTPIVPLMLELVWGSPTSVVGAIGTTAVDMFSQLTLPSALNLTSTSPTTIVFASTSQDGFATGNQQRVLIVRPIGGRGMYPQLTVQTNVTILDADTTAVLTDAPTALFLYEGSGGPSLAGSSGSVLFLRQLHDSVAAALVRAVVVGFPHIFVIFHFVFFPSVVVVNVCSHVCYPAAFPLALNLGRHFGHYRWRGAATAG